MRGVRRPSVSYASVPFEAPWYEPLLTPLVFLGNLAFAAWICVSWRTARVRWNPPLEALAERVEATGRRVIYYSWHAYEPLALLAFRDVPASLKPTGIGHDGIASRVLQLPTAWFGMRVWVYRRRSPIRPARQIIGFLQTERCHIGLFPDAGGPYGKMKPGLAEIARATDALVVPLIVRGRGLLKLTRPWRRGLPLPFCSLVAWHGPPLDGATTCVDECQSALEELEEKATREPFLFSSARPPS